MNHIALLKRITGRQLHNEVLLTEGRVTLVDAYLAGAVLLGLLLNALFGWWWSDPLAVYYGIREAIHALHENAKAQEESISAPRAESGEGKPASSS